MAKLHPELNGHLQHPQRQENPSFPYDALYCCEEIWEEDGEVDFESCFHGRREGESYCNHDNEQNSPQPPLIQEDLFWEDEELSSLFSKEEENQLHKTILTNPSLAAARRNAVDWMLKVNSHYSFTPLTAVLAVNYLDRFLVGFHFQTEKPWTTQLAAVACLSIAAKVEEIQVPLLLDLQVEDSKYVFEAKTIQRMEILVLSTLRWKMHPVTPLSFLDYMTRRLGLKDHLCWEFLRRCESILISVISDSRCMCYKPSVIATSTMLHVINGVGPYLGAEFQSQLLGLLGNEIDKDKVEDCSKVIRVLAKEVDGGQSIKRKFGSIPGSPNGVMDMSFCSDSSNDSWLVASSVSSSPEPLSKKSRAVQKCSHASADFLSIPR